jgi:hypothetical protein
MEEAEKLKYWQEGIDHFNDRRFWHAHESWEQGWLKLPELEKLHVQSLIQLCGVFDLVKRGRPSAALSLVRLALEKLEKIRKLGGVVGTYPRIEVSELESTLLGLASIQEVDLPRAVSQISLKAELLLSPR